MQHFKMLRRNVFRQIDEDELIPPHQFIDETAKRGVIHRFACAKGLKGRHQVQTLGHMQRSAFEE